MVRKVKILFKNTTKYSKQVYDEFLAFHRKKYRFSYIAFNALVIFAIIFCIILQISYHNFNLVIIFLVILTAFFLWRFLHPIIEVTEDYKSEKIQDEQEFTFRFYENNFKVENNKEYSIIKYSNLYKVFETKTFFYLYIDKTHALLVDKSTFHKNNPDEFSSFMRKKCFLGQFGTFPNWTF